MCIRRDYQGQEFTLGKPTKIGVDTWKVYNGRDLHLEGLLRLRDQEGRWKPKNSEGSTPGSLDSYLFSRDEHETDLRTGCLGHSCYSADDKVRVSQTTLNSTSLSIGPSLSCPPGPLTFGTFVPKTSKSRLS